MPLILFLIFSLIVTYVYFGYPALLWLMTRRKPPIEYISAEAEDRRPSLSLIIPAYNESSVIERKIQNTLSLSYPEDKLEIIVASDGSDDGTDEIVKRYADRGIRLYRGANRLGKTPTMMEAVKMARGTIFVFSDANAMYETDALEKLVLPFQDEQVGCVCGKLRYINREGTTISEGEALYWKYESRIKTWESKFNTLIGANGSIYAVRRLAYVPLDADLSDDLGFPLAAYASGYKIIFQPYAVSTEEAPRDIRTEFKKKSRFVAHQLTTLTRLWAILRPWRDLKFLFQVVSHKLLRNCVPCFLLGMLILSFTIPGPYGPLLLWGQVIFYGLALLGGLMYGHIHSNKVLIIPLYFCIVNAAALNGIFQYFRRKNYAVWNEK